MDACYKCSHYREDYNDTDSWNFCSNKESDNYLESIDNIVECKGTRWSLYKKYPLCKNCIYHQGCHSTIFGECWTCGKKHPNASNIEDNDWNWFEENKSIMECEFYEYGEQLVNVVLG